MCPSNLEEEKKIIFKNEVPITALKCSSEFPNLLAIGGEDSLTKIFDL